MLFSRIASLIIGQEGGEGVELSGLRIAFTIQKGSTKTPNKSTVRVWNASPDTRSTIETIGNVLILKAGYAEDVGAVTIFAGNVTRSLTVREGADWVTELELQDGFLEFRDTKISTSFAAGALTSQVLREISKQFGLPVRPMPIDVEDKQYASGFAFVGRVRDVLDKVCEYAGLEWSIQNREVQIIKKGGAFKQKSYLISPESGLIGSPTTEAKTMTEKAASKEGITSAQPGVRKTTKKDKSGGTQALLHVMGYKIKSLLQPSLEAGAYVQIKSKSIDSEFFKVEELTHSGDTHGAEWHTELSLRSIK